MVSAASCAHERSELTRLIIALPVALLLVYPVAAEEIVATFRLHAPELEEDAQVYITGSVPGLGKWNPGKVPDEICGKASLGICLEHEHETAH